MAFNFKKHTAIDFETYYDNTCSLTTLGTYAYTRHPDFDAYMVSIVNDDIRYVGHPKDFDWKQLKGHTLVAHNASFDQVVFESCVEGGTILGIPLEGWECTADLAVYLQFQRTLAGAVKYGLGKELSKEMRNWMKGRTWEDAIAEDKAKELSEYALNDSIFCWEFYKKYREKWPDREAKLSRHTRAMGMRGFTLDMDLVEKGLDHLDKQMFEAKSNLPWYDEIDPDTKKPYVIYSKKALAMECRKLGIDPPKSLSKDSPDCHKWMREHGDNLPFVTSMQNYTRMNTHYQRLKTMRDRCRVDKTVPFNLKYFGAEATGRWSGDAGLNVQNLPRDAKYGINLRNCIKAPEGKTFVIADFDQIEPRCAAYLTGDQEFLSLLTTGMSPYEAHARLTMDWTGGELKKEDPQLYLLAKVRVLALNYGAGWHRFYETVKSYGQEAILDQPYEPSDLSRFKEFNAKYHPLKLKEFDLLDNYGKRLWVAAFLQVTSYRASNPLLVARWKGHESSYKASIGSECYQIPLLSGRNIQYFKIRPELKGTSCQTQRGSKRRTYSYGPLLFENEIQATARECFADALLRLDDAGFDVVIHVHDEAVISVDENTAEESAKKINEVMSQTPDWLEGCPLATSYEISKHYKK
jgi:DNA polymerase